MTPTPKRRWAYSLRMLLAVVTAVVLFISWGLNNVYAAMAILTLMTGIALIVGVLVAARFLIQTWDRRKGG